MRRVFVCGLLVAEFVTLPCAFAQTLPASTIYGVVMDATGSVLTGAIIELRGTTLVGGPQVVASAVTGRYRFASIPPGTYDVTARYPDLSDVSRRGILVPLGVAVRIDLLLHVAPVDQSLVVTGGGPMLDISTPSMPTHVDGEVLLHRPNKRSLGEIVNMAPGVVRAVETGGAAFGGTISSNGVSVEGIDATEPRRQRISLPINYNWIQEAEVAAIGAGADRGNFTGASVNITLRSGGNRSSGLAEYWTTRQRWVDDNSGTGTPRRIVSEWDSSAQLGGALVKDRLWYFAGLEYYRLVDTPSGYRGSDTTSSTTPRAIIRMTGAARRGNRIDALIERSHLTKTGDGLSSLVPIESTSSTTSNDLAWNARSTWTTRDTLFEARSGGFVTSRSSDPTLPATRSGPPPEVERTTNTVSKNALNFANSRPSRRGAGLAITRIVGERAAHELRVGLEHEWTRSVEERGFPGDLTISLLNNVPVAANRWQGETTNASGTQTVLYVQDRWQLTPRVSIDAGIRMEANRSGIPVQGTVLSTTPLAPRVGIAWDISGNHRAALKAHYGRYFDSLLTNRVAFMDITRQHQTIFYNRNAAGELVETGRSPSLTARAIDPDIRHSYVDQYSIGIERQVGEHILLQALYMRRDFSQFMGMTDTGTRWEPFVIQDPGVDGQLGTADDAATLAVYRQINLGEAFLFYTNPRGAYRRYDALQAVGRRRYADGFETQISYTFSRNRGTVGNQDFVNAGQNDLGDTPSPLGPGVFMNPNAQINADGRAPYDLSELKALGVYRVPGWGGFVIGAVFRHETGVRWGRVLNLPPGILSPTEFVTIRAEPRGARALPSVNNLDLRVETTWPVRSAGRLALFGDVFNVTNQGVPTAVLPVSGPAFGRELSRADPRSLRVAIRYDF